ncbi:MAG: nucleoside hydrolase, partial [Proteobacteria bacterium]|nr:nucleoside hydrolase [Pseudomonadota bacterium]
DDGFAIVEAINAPDIDLIGITCVYGNAPHPQVFRVANEIVELKKVNVPVVAGAQIALPEHGDPGPSNDAVEFIAASLRTAPATIAAIGPLTTLGLLAWHYPDLLKQVQSLIVVAGRSKDRVFYIGGQGPVGDFNFENDPRSFDLTLNTSVPAVLAGFELTSQVCVTETDLDSIAANGNHAAIYFHRNSLDWCRYWTDTFPADPGFHPWDSATIAWIRHPEYFLTDQRRWHIDVPAKSKPQLICEPVSDGSGITYVHGFAPGGKEAFINDVVTTVY